MEESWTGLKTSFDDSALRVGPRLVLPHFQNALAFRRPHSLRSGTNNPLYSISTQSLLLVRLIYLQLFLVSISNDNYPA